MAVDVPSSCPLRAPYQDRREDVKENCRLGRQVRLLPENRSGFAHTALSRNPPHPPLPHAGGRAGVGAADTGQLARVFIRRVGRLRPSRLFRETRSTAGTNGRAVSAPRLSRLPASPVDGEELDGPLRGGSVAHPVPPFGPSHQVFRVPSASAWCPWRFKDFGLRIAFRPLWTKWAGEWLR